MTRLLLRALRHAGLAAVCACTGVLAVAQEAASEAVPSEAPAAPAPLADGAVVPAPPDVPVPPITRGSEPLWELGAIGLTGEQVAYPGSDTRVSKTLVLPAGIYRGRFVRAGEGGVGVRALKTAAAEVDIGFSGSFGSRSDDVPVRSGMPDLGTLVEFGPRLKLRVPQWLPHTRVQVDLPLRVVLDLSDSLHQRGTVFEPGLDLSWRLPGNAGLSARLSAIYGDQRLNQLFYGVEPQFEDLALQRPAYDAHAGLIATRLALTVSTQWSRDWRVLGFARWQSVAGGANQDSPLVRQTLGVTAGVSLVWTWLRSERSAAD